MEQDKHLQQILLNSATGASAGFTDAVMKRVNSLSEARLHYQPLVSPKWQRLFVVTFGGLVMAILVLCLLIFLSHIQVAGWLKSIEVPAVNYTKVLTFLITFWAVFAINTLVQKKQLRRMPVHNTHH